MKYRQSVINICIILVSLIVLIMSLEVIMQVYHAVRSRSAHTESAQEESLYIKLNSPVLYGLNPKHPDINSQGLRDDEVLINRPSGSLRILLLGDSVTFGTCVARGRIYPDHLEQLLQQRYGEIDVINAGVGGYTTFNELQYYLTEGRKYEPDIVILSFCLNDVANPRLHWGSETDKMLEIPVEAIPNIEHDKHYARPLIQKRERALYSLLRRSKLFNAIRWRWKLFTYHFTKPKIPTFITGDDTTSIRVLIDEESPEFRWLVSKFDQLNEAVTGDGSTLMIVLFPLAYQLDEDYPYVPQEHLSYLCAVNDIPCLDLLPSFRKYRKEELFLLENAGYNDVWHLTGKGHDVTARKLFDWLDRYIQKSDDHMSSQKNGNLYN